MTIPLIPISYIDDSLDTDYIELVLKCENRADIECLAIRFGYLCHDVNLDDFVWEDWEYFKAHKKDSKLNKKMKNLMKIYGPILMPERLLEARMVSNHFKVPIGTSIIRLRDLKWEIQ